MEILDNYKTRLPLGFYADCISANLKAEKIRAIMKKYYGSEKGKYLIEFDNGASLLCEEDELEFIEQD